MADRNAVRSYQRALALHGGKPRQVGMMHNNLGNSYAYLGDYANAAEHLGIALRQFQELGDQAGEALALCSLGVLDVRMGEFESAQTRLRASVALARVLGQREAELTGLRGLARALTEADRLRGRLDDHRSGVIPAGRR